VLGHSSKAVNITGGIGVVVESVLGLSRALGELLGSVVSSVVVSEDVLEVGFERHCGVFVVFVLFVCEEEPLQRRITPYIYPTIGLCFPLFGKTTHV
jgi:Na+-transporting NADH:ubiquinone oxidoreductase subunit NqrE